MLTVLPIRIRDDGVFAVDQHGLDAFATFLKGCHFGHGLAQIEVWPLISLRECVARSRVRDRHATRENKCLRTAIARPLDVVLAAHGIDPRSLDPEVASHEREIAE